MTPRVAVIVLAAGRSTRFASADSHKLLVPLGGTPVIRRSVQRALDAAVGDVVIVMPPESAAFESALANLQIRVVRTRNAANGMSASLRAGIEAVQGSIDAAIVALADQPTMRAEAYRRVVAEWATSGAPIVIPRYPSTSAPGHPTLFAASVFDELLELVGDVGARSVVTRDPNRVAIARMNWPAPRDIDTQQDLLQVEAELAQLAMTDPEP